MKYCIDSVFVLDRKMSTFYSENVPKVTLPADDFMNVRMLLFTSSASW